MRGDRIAHIISTVHRLISEKHLLFIAPLSLSIVLLHAIYLPESPNYGMIPLLRSIGTFWSL